MEVSSWENHLFLWAIAAIAMLNNQRVGEPSRNVYPHPLNMVDVRRNIGFTTGVWVLAAKKNGLRNRWFEPRTPTCPPVILPMRNHHVEYANHQHMGHTGHVGVHFWLSDGIVKVHNCWLLYIIRWIFCIHSMTLVFLKSNHMNISMVCWQSPGIVGAYTNEKCNTNPRFCPLHPSKWLANNSSRCCSQICNFWWPHSSPCGNQHSQPWQLEPPYKSCNESRFIPPRTRTVMIRVG